MTTPPSEDRETIRRLKINTSRLEGIKKHEKIGVIYLLEKGYKLEDIVINSGIRTPTGTPDIYTSNDKQYWEVKKYGSAITFTSAQITMDDDTNIIIFGHNNEFIESIKFGDLIKDDLKYRSHFVFNLDTNSAIYVHRYLDIDKCDYQNNLGRFGMISKNTKTFYHLNFLNVSVSTQTLVLTDETCQDEDAAFGTFLKMKDEGGSNIEYYINQKLVGIAHRGDILTIRIAGSEPTKKLINWLKNMSEIPQHVYEDKYDEFIFDLECFSESVGKCLFSPSVFINDILVGNLSDGDNLTIKAIGSSEQFTIKECFKFAAVELEHQRIVNSIRYSYLTYKESTLSLIPPHDFLVPHDFELYDLCKLEEMYVETMHKLLDIELYYDMNLQRIIRHDIDKS